MIDMLRDSGGEKIRVFAGGGGVIIPQEIARLEAYGVTRIYSPEDGQEMGLNGMIDNIISLCRHASDEDAPGPIDQTQLSDWQVLARVLTMIENNACENPDLCGLRSACDALSHPVPVLGITGTGGAGKSSLTDELILRFKLGLGDDLKIGIIAVDPTRRKTGGPCWEIVFE